MDLEEGVWAGVKPQLQLIDFEKRTKNFGGHP